MSYDPSFDQTRLNQLVEQCLTGECISGKVVFIGNDKDEGLLGATFFFDHNAFGTIETTGFKHLLVSLLDILIRYRVTHNQPNPRNGAVYLEDNVTSIQWLSHQDAQALRQG